MNKVKNSYRESASKKFESYIEDLEINKNFVTDLTTLLTNKEMDKIYEIFDSFSVTINILTQTNNEKDFLSNQIEITKSGKMINVYLSTNTFIYSILRYDVEKKLLELQQTHDRFKTKMPSFLFAKLFLEELELIMQTKIQQIRIKSIYNKNRY